MQKPVRAMLNCSVAMKIWPIVNSSTSDLGFNEISEDSRDRESEREGYFRNGASKMLC